MKRMLSIALMLSLACGMLTGCAKSKGWNPLDIRYDGYERGNRRNGASFHAT